MAQEIKVQHSVPYVHISICMSLDFPTGFL
jgi:hypothetical protein